MVEGEAVEEREKKQEMAVKWLHLYTRSLSYGVCIRFLSLFYMRLLSLR